MGSSFSGLLAPTVQGRPATVFWHLFFLLSILFQNWLMILGVKKKDEDSSRRFPLLDARIRIFLKQIVRKMHPTVCSTVREISFTVDKLLMEEAVRRSFVARATFAEFMRPDVVTVQGVPLRVSQWLHMEAEMRFEEDSVHIARNPAPFCHTSLLFHKNHPDCQCSKYSYEFWKNHIRSISAATAMSHLAGSVVPYALAKHIADAAALISLIAPFKIRIDRLGFKCCSPTAISQMLEYFQPNELILNSDDSSIAYQQNEAVAIDQIDLDKVRYIRFSSRTEYSDRIVEHFLRHIQQSDPCLRSLTVDFPPDKLPQDRFIVFGLACYTLKRSYQNVAMGIQEERTLLIRTDSSPPRHIMLIAGSYTTTTAPGYKLCYRYVSDVDDLLRRICNFSCDRNHPLIADFSPSEIRDIFNDPHWPAVY